jgi:glutaredoxin
MLQMVWKSLWSWLRRGRARTPVAVVMYTRHGCHLCDDAWRLLQEMAKDYPLQLKKVDIDKTEDMRERFGDRVPVLFINDRERMWGPINRVLLERHVRAETGKSGTCNKL